MDIATIQCIMEETSLNGREIENKYGISCEVRYAIRECSRDMQLEAVRYKIGFLQPGMKSQDIIDIMNG